MPDRLNHIYLGNIADQINYKPRQQQGGETRIPVRNRENHSQYLARKFESVWEENESHSSERTAMALPTRDGAYIQFSSQAGSDLITKSLEDRRKGIRLLNITEQESVNGLVTLATVYVPRGRENFFIKKIEDYAEKDTPTGKPRNAPLVNSIEEIKLAFLDALWTDSENLKPNQNAKWCEAWLRYEEGTANEVLYYESVQENFFVTCSQLEIETKSDSLKFPERIVINFKANSSKLLELIKSLDTLAEIRAVKETAALWVRESNTVQREWVNDLLNRANFNDSNVSICILDSGVNSEHSLLAPVLNLSDCLTVNNSWGVHDHLGHGTLMSGLAAFGDLQSTFETNSSIEVNHRLISVKILSPAGNTDYSSYGAITQQAISRAEISNPTRSQIYCMAVTTKENVVLGKPSSWSAAVDQVAFGDSNDTKRLIIISAGNIINRNVWLEYPEGNLLQSVQDPAQSWNALTVGAYTEKCTLTDNRLNGWSPVAQLGELSPYSSTSHMWDSNKWPIKPDVVFEGGNIIKDSMGNVDECEDTGLFSTSHRLLFNQFDIINATSAATAQAAHMAAKIQSTYPEIWPETVRGLIVHSDEWTDQLINQFSIDLTKKGSVKSLLRTCGYGVPSLSRALYSTKSSLTLIAEEFIQPYGKSDDASRLVTKDMHLIELPWPTDVLRNLGDVTVRIKISLSYFIEPGPGEVGWKDRYRYSSYALRFDLNTPLESKEDFLKRINVAARDEDETTFSDTSGERWTVGKTNRSMGTIHSDICTDTAANIASCNYIAVYPVIGWWRERGYLGKWNSMARYSLIVSIETPAQDIDIYTEIANKIEVPVEVKL